MGGCPQLPFDPYLVGHALDILVFSEVFYGWVSSVTYLTTPSCGPSHFSEVCLYASN
jgi:hypothetical protein